MNLNKLNKEVELINSQLEHLENLSLDGVTQQVNTSIIELAEKEVSPDSEDGKKFVKIADMLRKLGAKLLNLLKIEFSITFAGVTIVHFTIPKLDKNLKIKN